MDREGRVDNRFIASDGIGLAVHELGGGPDGVPIVLQHGFSATTQTEWVDCGIAARLDGLGRRVVGLDARGHGASDKPHQSRFYGEARMAADIRELATHLGFARYDLVGYSMGAVIALLVATDEPRLRRLAIGGVGEGVVACGGVDRRALDNRLLAAAMRADDISGFPAHVRGFRTGAEARGNDCLALAAHADVVHASPIALDRIAVPTLLLAGDVDPLAVRPEILAAAIPGARLVLVPGDHGSARTGPGFVAALAGFLG